MSAVAIAAAVNGGGGAVAGIEAALTRAGVDDSGAVLRTYPDSALAQAAAVEARIAAGEQLPLAGVPVLLKDNICYRDHPVEACSAILEGFRPPYSATVVERLLAAGAVILGTASMDEFAMGSSNETSRHGPVRNPHGADRVPGGSSGGSAAAVGGGTVPLALGSDTGGSIRQPAAFCGCVGFKPTYGSVSRHGLLAFGSSLDVIGPLSASVADCRLAFGCLAGPDPLDGTSIPPLAEAGPVTAAGLRIGVPVVDDAALQPAVAAAFRRALDLCRAAGAELVTIDLPHERHAVAVYYIVATGEASSNLGRYDGVHFGRRAPAVQDLDDLYRRSRGAGFGAEVKRRIMLGTWVLSAGYVDAYYRQAMRIRRLICHDFQAAFAQCDVLLGPTAPTTAFRHGEKSGDPLTMYLSDVFTISANLAGLPAISLPVDRDGDGLPTAIHLQGPQGGDHRLLAIAGIIEGLLAAH